MSGTAIDPRSVTAPAATPQGASRTTPSSTPSSTTSATPAFVMQSTPKALDPSQPNEALRRAAAKLARSQTAQASVAPCGPTSGVQDRRNAVAILAAQNAGQAALAQGDAVAQDPPVVADDAGEPAADWAVYAWNAGAPKAAAVTGADTPPSLDKDSAEYAAFVAHATSGRASFDAVTNSPEAFCAPQDGGLMQLLWARDPALRMQLWTDAMLRFRCGGRVAHMQTQRCDGDRDVVVRAQEVLLSALAMPTGTLAEAQAAWREYALMRLALAAHPYAATDSSGRAAGLFAVVRGWPCHGDKDSVVDPKVRLSVAAVERWIRERVFTVGPEDSRVATFVGLVKALELVSARKYNEARSLVATLASASGEPSLVALDAKVGSARFVDIADVIASYLSEARAPDTAVPMSASDFFGVVKQLLDALHAAGPVAHELGEKMALAGPAQQAVAAAVIRLQKREEGQGLTSELEATRQSIRASVLQLASTLDQVRASGGDSFCADVIGALEQALASAHDQLQVDETAAATSIELVANTAWNARVALLQDVATAREAVLSALQETTSGAARRHLLEVDALLDRVSLTALDESALAIGGCDSALERTEALVAVHTALRLACTSGLPALRDPQDPMAGLRKSLEQLASDAQAMLPGPGETREVSPRAYRKLMLGVEAAVHEIEANIAALLQSRLRAADTAKCPVDTDIAAALVQQSPLGVAQAIAAKARRAGIVEEVSDRCITNLAGLDLVAGQGPVLFSGVTFVDRLSDLDTLNVPSTDLVVVKDDSAGQYTGQAVGGIAIAAASNTRSDPDLAACAAGAGALVLAFADLMRLGEFFERAKAEHGLYFDDREGETTLATVDYAIERGLIDRKTAATLLPGQNVEIQTLCPAQFADRIDLVREQHEFRAASRPTQKLTLYAPPPHADTLYNRIMTERDVAALPVAHARAIAGEKGMWLARLGTDLTTKRYVPSFSVIPTPMVKALLQRSGVWAEWQQAFQSPDGNIFNSKFYRDADYRTATCAKLAARTKDCLNDYFYTGDAGERLYEGLKANSDLDYARSLMIRPSFVGEDPAYLHGLGAATAQSATNSCANVLTAIAAAVASFWDRSIVERNVAQHVDLQDVVPALVVMEKQKSSWQFVKGRFSVPAARDNPKRFVSALLSQNANDRVRASQAERGLIGADSYQLQTLAADSQDALLGPSSLHRAREFTLRAQALLRETIEPGFDLPIEVEAIRKGDEWNIINVRVMQS